MASTTTPLVRRALGLFSPAAMRSVPAKVAITSSSNMWTSSALTVAQQDKIKGYVTSTGYSIKWQFLFGFKGKPKFWIVATRIDLASPTEGGASHGDVVVPHLQTEQFQNDQEKRTVPKDKSVIALPVAAEVAMDAIDARKSDKLNAEVFDAASRAAVERFIQNMINSGGNLEEFGLPAYPYVTSKSTEAEKAAGPAKIEQWWADFESNLDIAQDKFLDTKSGFTKL